IVPVRCQQSYSDGIPARHKAVAVVLDLVNPVRAGRRSVGSGWEARFDEAGGRRPAGTRQHDGCNIGRYLLRRISSSSPTMPIRSTVGTISPAQTPTNTLPASVERWPSAKITLRNGARIIGKTWLADD